MWTNLQKQQYQGLSVLRNKTTQGNGNKTTSEIINDNKIFCQLLYFFPQKHDSLQQKQ